MVTDTFQAELVVSGELKLLDRFLLIFFAAVGEYHLPGNRLLRDG